MQNNGALVEVAAAVSESMQEQVARLAEVVSVFKLSIVQHGRNDVGAQSGVAKPVRPAPTVVCVVLPRRNKVIRREELSGSDV